MIWINKVRTIIGKFWTFLFDNESFVHAVEYIIVIAANTIYNKFRYWIGCKDIPYNITTDNRGGCGFPFVILIDYNSVHIKSASIDEILNGAAIGSASTKRAWCATAKELIKNPVYMQDHILYPNNVLVNGYDFDYANGYFVFYKDPKELSLPTIKLVDDNNNVKLYYKLFGIAKKEPIYNELTSTFISSSLTKGTAIAWDMYRKGATVYNVKKLLAEASDSIIAEENGIVSDIWKENDTWCIFINSKLYTSTKEPLISKGATVKTGDILAGSLKFFSGEDDPTETDIPGIRVRVDAGELVALNKEQAANIYNGVNILPLVGDNTTVERYTNRCYHLATETSCPIMEVPDTVNPYQFIVKKLRKGRAVAIQLAATNLSNLAAAIACIRKCSSASSMINIYIKAETETHSIITSSFTATAGMSAVATSVSVGVKEAYAEATVLK